MRTQIALASGVVLLAAGCSAAPSASTGTSPAASPTVIVAATASPAAPTGGTGVPTPILSPLAPGSAPPFATSTPGSTTPPATPSPSTLAPPSPTTPVAPPPTTPVPGPAGWTEPEQVSTRYYEAYDLAIGSDGVAHAAAEFDDAIWYLTNADGSWTRERLSTPVGSRGHDGEPQVALDRDGSLAIAFIRYQRWRCELSCFGRPEGIYVLTNRGGAWSEPQRAPVDDPYLADIAVQDGRVHLVAGHGDESVWYGTRPADGDWVGEALPGPAFGGQLALASDGTARVLYSHESLRFAVAASPEGGFTVEELPVDAGSALLALDAADRPHIVVESSEGGARYMVRSDGGWSAPEPAFPGLRIEDDCGETVYEEIGASVLAVSASATAHLLSPNEVLFGGLWYASNRTGSFSVLEIQPPDQSFGRVCLEEIAIDGDPSLPQALAVDDGGRPHVLYQSANEMGLLYTVGPGD